MPVTVASIRHADSLSVKHAPSRVVSQRSWLAVTNVASSSLQGVKGGKRETVELFVATYEDVTKLGAAHAGQEGAKGVTTARYAERRQVTPPRQPARALVVTRTPMEVLQPNPSKQPSEVAVREQFQYQRDSSKALRAELTMVHTDLKSKSAEAAKLANIVKSKDKEILQLKSTLKDRDAKLKSSKEDLLGSRLLLQEKDALLETAYEALTTACKERSELRRQLIEVQTELHDTREELRQWTEELSHLKSVMDSLDVDEDDLEEAKLAAKAMSAGRGAQEDGMLSMLHDLTQFSRQVLAEAKEDEKVYEQAMGHSGSTSTRSRAALRSGGNAAFW